MANLAKIKDVCLYVAFTENAQECFDVKKLLNDNGINPKTLIYADEVQHPEVFNSLSTWSWNDGETKQFTKFPIVHWTNCYDDFTVVLQSATSASDPQLSELLANKNLVG